MNRLQFQYDERAPNGKVVEKAELRRNFYSVPDLVQITICNNKAGEPLSNSLRNHKSQDNVNESDGQSADGTSSTSSMKSCSSTVKMKSKNKTSPLYAINAPPSRTSKNFFPFFFDFIKSADLTVFTCEL